MNYFSKILINQYMPRIKLCFYLMLIGIVVAGACKQKTKADIIIRNGMLYDGSVASPVRGDIAIAGDTILAMGDLSNYDAGQEIDAEGMAVAPGFINVLSWAVESLLQDGKGQSDTRQGVTLEVFGEGNSAGPLNAVMKKQALADFPENKFDTTWTTLKEYLQMMENKVTPNIASFVGASTIRQYVIGNEDREPTAAELEKMKSLVARAMEDGALGLASALIYPPGFYAKTSELTELAKVVGTYNGMYISHIRSEGNQLLESIDELIKIAEEGKLAAEVYHLKMAGSPNWNKYNTVVNKIDSARKAGLKITTDMYTYAAAGTGLSATMPPWAQEGGFDKFLQRLSDKATRAKIKKEMLTPTNSWENMFLSNGGPSGILFSSFRNDSLKKYTGKTLEDVAKERMKPAEEVAMDLIVQDSSRVECIYFMMTEDNVKKQLQLPYMSFCSDAASLAPEGDFLKYNPHPRAYGSFARLLGKYVRDEKIISLEKAIHGLTMLPATNLKLKNRGILKEGYFADIVVFDPEKITDHATFKNPHQYSTGMKHVFVNGVQVLKNGEHTGKTPGRVVYGPGFKAKN
jgi:N-acyl-D-amino-acid deacylase